ncbi:bidirectional sugar transporter SWEET14-like [Bidens hawaiensis]|uniref:bidirectional sugar transporter SWEET14-like n=1 Tax=Bidens hawaiensis TaxID=980011 RepID=UPI00404AE067
MVIAGHFPHLSFAFGLMGNIVSFMVFLSPLPTFYKVYKKKSTEGFQSIPYVVGLFSAMLWIYYALLKGNAMLLITINSVGIVIQTFYLCVYVFYAPKKARMDSLKLIMLFIVIGFGLIVLLTQFLTKGAQRGVIVGWVCLVFALCVFVAPLGVLRQVIRTKSVEYMPIMLSLALTLSAVMWFFYGLFLGDINIAIPNTLGFTFGIFQIILYFVYKNKRPVINDKIIEFKEKMNEIDEPGVMEEKDQHAIDMVMVNALINAPNAHGVAVVPGPVLANHTIEAQA